MQIIFSACHGILVCFCVQLGSLLGMRLVGQELAPGKCVPTSTSWEVGKDMRD